MVSRALAGPDWRSRLDLILPGPFKGLDYRYVETTGVGVEDG